MGSGWERGRGRDNAEYDKKPGQSRVFRWLFNDKQ